MRIAIVTLVLLCTSAMAADVYVSPSGNDASGGTNANPKKTIESAFSVMSGGDTLHLLTGSYQRFRVPKRLAGTRETQTIVRAMRAGTAVLDGCQTYGVLIEPYADYVTIEGIKIQNVTGTGIIARECKHYEIRDCVVSNCTESGIDAGSGHIPFDMQGVIDGCVTTGNGTTNQHHGIYASHSNATIRDCTSERNSGYGISVWDDVSGTVGCVVEGNRVAGNKSGAVIVSGDANGSPCHNLIYGNSLRVDTTSATSSCVQLWNTNGAVVEGNVMLTAWATLLEQPGTVGTVFAGNCEYPVDSGWMTHANRPPQKPVVDVASDITIERGKRHVIQNVLVPGSAYRCSFSATATADGKQIRIEYPNRKFPVGLASVECRTAFVATKPDFMLHANSPGEYSVSVRNLLVEKAYGPGIEDGQHGQLFSDVGSAMPRN